MRKLLEEFRNPSKEFTAYPFWFWNDDITKEGIRTSLVDFQEKGIDGVIIHPRIGLSKEIGYLTEPFFERVSYAVEQAEILGMKIILYDEGMYPSGAAHGKIVNTDPKLASKGIVLLKKDQLASFPNEIISILGCYNIEDDGEEWLITKGDSYVLIFAYSGGTIRGVHEGEDDHEKPPKSADLLSSQATQYFINYTHDDYYKRLSSHFGKTIIGFFTDEPDILGRNAYQGMKAWTRDLQNELCLTDLDLPRLCLEPKSQWDRGCLDRYSKLVSKHLGEHYYHLISKWCLNHNVSLMGHPHGSMDMGYLEYFHIPGQDMVWRWVGPGSNNGITGDHSTAAKCSADASRHLNRRRNSNEIFGCCGPANKQWAFTLSDMKWYLDWLFVRGVNMIIPHAFFYSLRGIRKEDRPPDVGPNNLWWPYYKQLSDYMKRMSWLMTDSTNQTTIAVLCRENKLPWKEVVSLFQSQVEFNYLEEKYLNRAESGPIKVGQQSYDCLLVTDELAMIHRDKLLQLAANGMTVFYESDIADLINHASFRPKLSKPQLDIRYSQIKKEDVVFHVFSNEGDKKADFEWDSGKLLAEWLPETGEVYQLLPTQTATELELYPGDLRIFTEAITGLEIKAPLLLKEEVAATIKIKTAPLALNDLEDWSDKHPYYSGMVDYDLTVSIEKNDFKSRYVLDLGDVYDIVLERNHFQMIQYRKPYQIIIDKFDENNEVTVNLSVMNSLTNRMDRDPRLSGIIGPVKLFQIK